MSEFSKQLQVYVVEDSPIMLQLLTVAIKAAGAELVGHGASAQRAIREISVLQPDLILVDLSLDLGDGFDVLRVLQDRGLARSARKVVLTNHANAEYRARCFRLGADQFCDKSSETWQVLALINAMAVRHGANPHPATGPDPENHRRK
ncbi:MAG TPA: response regulator [Casimicrobiaceae bacterium]|jgi:DNA-binding NarL/FixJ family response regulator|nr:response regulator [Casimicrobiaceae bacterium]